jgi:hypothetical protein
MDIRKRGNQIKTNRDLEKEDKQKKISYQVCKMEIDNHDKHIVLEDHNMLRLWYFEDLKSLIRESGKFRLEAIYNNEYKQNPLNTHISGELDKPILCT